MTASRRTFLKGLAVAPALFGGLSSTIAAYAQEAKAHGDLIVAIAKPAGNLDPHKYIGLWAVQDLMFEPLMRYGKNGSIEPALATEWAVEDNGKLLRVKLRQNVTFQDGTPWDAEAMMWNLDRWIGKPANNWMNSSRLYSGHRIVDPHTVELQFKEPVLGLLYEFSYVRPSRFLSPKSVDKDGNYQAPVEPGHGFRKVRRTAKAPSSALMAIGAICQPSNTSS